MSTNGDNRRRNDAALLHQSLARLRQALFKLFSALFLYPNEERLNTLRAAGATLLQEAAAWETCTFSEPLRNLLEVLQRLPGGPRLEAEVDHTRLFSVKAVVPPHESSHLDPQRQSAGWTAVQLEQEYREAGLQLAPRLAEQPDHIAVELEFMAYLCGCEAGGGASQWPDGSDARACQSAFLARHLGQWFPRFAQLMRSAAPGPLYNAVLPALEAYLDYEMACRRPTDPPSVRAAAS